MTKFMSRGQALYETTIAMPLFLIGLFGVIYAMKESSLAARVQLAVRYGGMVNSQHEPYESFSLYSVYATIDNSIPAPVSACYGGDGSQLTSGYAPFWLPSSSASLTNSCPSQVVIINGPEAYSQPIILRNNYSSIQAVAPESGFISKRVSTSTVRAAQNFFRSPDVSTLLNCTTLGATVKASLEGETDTTAPLPVATPLPQTVTSSAVVNAVLPSCATTTYTAPAAPY